MKNKIQHYILFVFRVFIYSNLFAQQHKTIERDFTIETGKNLSIYLEGDAGSVFIDKSHHAEKGFAKIKYNRRKASADIYYEKDKAELVMSIDQKSWINNDINRTEIDIEIPDNVPTYMDCNIKAGEFKLNLGGIKLKGFEMRSWAGEAVVEFTRPNLEIIENMKIDLNFGETRVLQLGNANFKHAVIDGAAGAVEVDLTGEYKSDARVDIDLEIGELVVILPDDRKIGVKMRVSKWGFFCDFERPSGFHKQGKYYYSDNYDDAELKLMVNIEAGMGSLRVKWD